MSEQEKTETEKALEQLTPREAEVLRKRFGLTEEPKKPTPEPMPIAPPDGDENGGPGGVPAPAKPPS